MPCEVRKTTKKWRCGRKQTARQIISVDNKVTAVRVIFRQEDPTANNDSHCQLQLTACRVGRRRERVVDPPARHPYDSALKSNGGGTVGKKEKRMLVLWLLLWSISGFSSLAQAEEKRLTDRYFLSGDGTVSLTNPKTNSSARVQYRASDGTYPTEARQQIDRLFGVSEDSGDHISLRLISALDFIEDRFALPIVLISGYRSQEYNDNLRTKGGGAAKASLHIEGMAADIQVRKSMAAKIWDSVKEMGCCGIGFYGGDSVHIDTGPARYWTQSTSKVRTNISENNKSIMVRTDQDIYLPGEKVEVKLARVTAYPVSVVPTFVVSEGGNSPREFTFAGQTGTCVPVRDVAERTFVWQVPEDLPPEGKVQLQLRFCDKQFAEMPDQIVSNEIEVR